jgi:hypothetical protein
MMDLLANASARKTARGGDRTASAIAFTQPQEFVSAFSVTRFTNSKKEDKQQ